MKASNRRQRGKGGLELMEEATQVLRFAPRASLACYYVGTLPFILGLLYFWADMSRSPLAYQHLTDLALGLALLFLWMKFWQTLFANSLRAHISAQAPARWSFRRCLRIFIIQTALQPSALFLLPLALLPGALPFGWVYAFYQSVTTLTDGETGEVGAVLKRSYKQCLLWPRQNHLLLALFLAFGLCVFLNWASVCLVLPQLLKVFLGIESVYTKSPASLLNSTFFAALFGLTYLCVDPIIKTVYLLRCFYGESLQSGEDLKAELKQFLPAAQLASITLLLLFLVCAPASNAAEAATPPASEQAATPPGISAPNLDRAIGEVMTQPKYAWRMPREKAVEDETARPGPFARFFASVGKTIRRWARAALEWILELLDRWFKSKRNQPSTSKGFDWVGSLQALFFVLLVALACALAIFLIRVWQRRRRQEAPVSSEAIYPVPDVADERVGAEQLPEDGWITLGREHLARGELRLAMRAFYFASLAQLAARHLIAIAKFKSNRDYERELRRRGHSLPELLSRFGENVLVFDRSWYGRHALDPAMVNQFASNVERIKAIG